MEGAEDFWLCSYGVLVFSFDFLVHIHSLFRDSLWKFCECNHFTSHLSNASPPLLPCFLTYSSEKKIQKKTLKKNSFLEPFKTPFFFSFIKISKRGSSFTNAKSNTFLTWKEETFLCAAKAEQGQCFMLATLNDLFHVHFLFFFFIVFSDFLFLWTFGFIFV